MTEEQARGRFMLLNLVRFGGVAIAFLGIAITVRRLVEPAEIVGYAFIAVGMLCVLVVPQRLARHWKKTDAE